MTQTAEQLELAGLEVIDLGDESLYAKRRLHSRNGSMQMEGLHRLAMAFVDRPDSILQELVNAAVRLCGADSAGVSIEREGGTPEHFTTGSRRRESTARLSVPRFPNIPVPALERNAPQQFRVGRPSSIFSAWKLPW